MLEDDDEDDEIRLPCYDTADGQKLSGGTCSVLVFESDNPDLLQHQICEDEEKDVGRKQKEAQSKSSESIT